MLALKHSWSARRRSIQLLQGYTGATEKIALHSHYKRIGEAILCLPPSLPPRLHRAPHPSSGELRTINPSNSSLHVDQSTGNIDIPSTSIRIRSPQPQQPDSAITADNDDEVHRPTKLIGIRLLLFRPKMDGSGDRVDLTQSTLVGRSSASLWHQRHPSSAPPSSPSSNAPSPAYKSLPHRRQNDHPSGAVVIFTTAATLTSPAGSVVEELHSSALNTTAGSRRPIPPSSLSPPIL